MPTLSHFSLPAGIHEFSNPDLQGALIARWSRYVASWTDRAIQGDPWTVLYDHDRAYYFNPLITPVPDDPLREVIYWTAFPNRVQYLLEETYPGKYSEEDILRIADEGGLPDIPSVDCPALDTSSPMIPYHPAGPRGWQDEYCEWAVKRDPVSGKILKVDFVCENSDYWFTMWRVDPAHVLSLYQELISLHVAMEDLYLRDADDNPVIDPQNDGPAYNPLNKWNSGPHALPDRGGAVHLTSLPNTLPDEIYEAASATIIRTNDSNSQALVCAGNYGGPFRHSDPHIVFNVNQVVKANNVRATIGDPVGLYLQMPDFSGYALPDVPGAKGKTASDFWTVKRGSARGTNPDLPDDMSYILHATFEVPEELGFTISDITLEGAAINYASQITQTFKVALGAVAIPSPTPLPMAVPSQTPAPNPLPAPTQMMPYDVLVAGGDPGEGGATPSSPVSLRQGQTIKNIALVCTGAKDGATVTIATETDALEVTVKKFLPKQPVVLAGMEIGEVVDLIILDITAPKAIPPGFYGVGVVNPDGAGGPAATWILYVEG